MIPNPHSLYSPIRTIAFVGGSAASEQRVKLEDLFTDFMWRRPGDITTATRKPDSFHSIMDGGTVRSPFYCFSGRPTQQVIDYICDAMLKIDYDTIRFEIVVRDDGSALVSANYDHILGSLWLAFIDVDELPPVPDEIIGHRNAPTWGKSP
jgi:hypothetical protein